jgi:hypothetical protein
MLISVYCGLLNDWNDLSGAGLSVVTACPTAVRLKFEFEEVFECFIVKVGMVFLRAEFLQTRYSGLWY